MRLGEFKRRNKDTGSKTNHRDTLSQSERVIDGLSNILPVETVGSLRGIVLDKRNQQAEKQDALAAQNPNRDLLTELGVTAQEIQTFQELLATTGANLPATVDKATLNDMLEEKRRALQREEVEKQLQSQQEARQASIRASQRREKTKTVGKYAAAAATISGVVYGAVVGIEAIFASNRADAIAYEQTHQITPEPTGYSYRGWRVRDPQLAPKTGFEFIPPRDTVVPLVGENKEVKILHGSQEEDTGIAFADYEDTKGAHVTQIKVGMNESDSLFSNGQEELLPESTASTPNIIELESRTGEHLLINIREDEAPGGSNVFVSTPVKAQDTH